MAVREEGFYPFSLNAAESAARFSAEFRVSEQSCWTVRVRERSIAVAVVGVLGGRLEAGGPRR
ncbi:hypothetical protein GCM10010121_075300 [Streptomyces brasiliensis]|uniref:Uncharacterized protein n=1 Tax=Streptomyces brasiliensis TaxID=1954 RepID=A0A917L9F4_9ACTN|nr:hypothetical protein GCM10010121_075300 [Streptomyces brasiliensis]